MKRRQNRETDVGQSGVGDWKEREKRVQQQEMG